MMTPRMRELLTFIDGYIQARGVSPSFDEMKAALKLASKSGIHRMLRQLEERGFIRQIPHRSRAVQIVVGAKLAGDLPPDEWALLFLSQLEPERLQAVRQALVP
jgi:repressor LexA